MMTGAQNFTWENAKYFSKFKLIKLSNLNSSQVSIHSNIESSEFVIIEILVKSLGLALNLNELKKNQTPKKKERSV